MAKKQAFSAYFLKVITEYGSPYNKLNVFNTYNLMCSDKYTPVKSTTQPIPPNIKFVFENMTFRENSEFRNQVL